MILSSKITHMYSFSVGVFAPADSSGLLISDIAVNLRRADGEQWEFPPIRVLADTGQTCVFELLPNQSIWLHSICLAETMLYKVPASIQIAQGCYNECIYALSSANVLIQYMCMCICMISSLLCIMQFIS